MRQEIQKIIEDGSATDQEINLCGKQITDYEIVEIADLIVLLQPLTRSINLSNNNLSDQGVVELCQRLKRLKHLTLLDLQGNHLSDRGFLAVFGLHAHFDQKLSLSLGENELMKVSHIERLKEKAIRDHNLPVVKNKLDECYHNLLKTNQESIQYFKNIKQIIKESLHDEKINNEMNECVDNLLNYLRIKNE